MKKIYSLIMCAVIGVCFVNAQSEYKPQAKSFAVELQFMPFGLANATIMTVNNGNAFGISPRYYISDRLELRADILFGINGHNSKDSIYDYYDEGYEYGFIGLAKTRRSQSSFGINLGVNYHFNGTERISPYIGGFIGGGFSRQLTKEQMDNHINPNDSRFTKYSSGEWYVNVCAVTGFNWYITKGLYIGAELGLGFGLSRSLNSVYLVAVSPDDKPIEDIIKPTSFDYMVGFIANPAIRLGWKF